MIYVISQFISSSLGIIGVVEDSTHAEQQQQQQQAAGNHEGNQQHQQHDGNNHHETSDDDNEDNNDDENDGNDHENENHHQETATETTTRRNRRRTTNRVSFSHVETRLYNRIVGENPNTEIPLSLGWKYNVLPESSVDEACEHHDSDDYVRGKYYEATEMKDRIRSLLDAGYTRSQINRDERRRRVQLALEWGYRSNRMEMVTCSFPNAQVFIKRYVAEI